MYYTAMRGADLGLDKIDLPAEGRKAQATIRAMADEVLTLMAPYDAFDLVVNLYLRNAPINPDTYKETTHEGLLVIPEYAALLLLSRGSREGSEPTARLIPGNTIEACNAKIRQILHLVQLEIMGRLAPLEDRQLSTLRFSQLSKELMIRVPSFPHQEEATLRQLFEHHAVAEKLTESVGVDLSDALTLWRAISESQMQKLADELAMVDRMRADALAGPLDESYGPLGEVVEEARRRVPRKRLPAELTRIGFAMAWTAIGSVLQCTAQELADSTGIDIARVRAFLDLFSVSFGEADATEFSGGNNAMKNRPITHDQEGAYLCVSPGNLLFAIRPAFEGVLKKSNRWESYQQVRATYLEQSAATLLRDTLRPTESYMNLAYDRDGRRYEIDVLLLLDTVAVAVECKAAALTDPARRAAPARLQDDLRKIVRDADDQSRRDREHILSGGVFENKRGQVVPIDLSRITRVFTITVTLEDLSALAPSGLELIDAGILAKTDECPLVVGIHDLELICKCKVVDIPVLLIHFMHRRDSSRHFGNVSAFDELDFFMYYLRHGLYLEEMFGGEEPPDGFRLLSFTDELDAYIRWTIGERRVPARKPRQEMPKLFEELLRELDAERPPSFVEASIMLMELSGEERQRLARLLRSSRQRTTKERRPHDFSQTYSGTPSYGLTVMTVLTADIDEAARRLETYCLLKKHQTKREAWIGLLSLADDNDGLMHGYQYLSFPWEEDQELDAAVAMLRLRPMPEPVA